MFRIWATFELDWDGDFIAVAALGDFPLNQFLVSLTVPTNGMERLERRCYTACSDAG